MPQYWFYSATGVATVAVTGGSTDTSMNFELVYYQDTDLYQCGSFLQPDALAGSSMILVDGTQSSKEMRRSVACNWLISPSSNSPVTLLFDWALIKGGGSVTVYDGTSNAASNSILWSGTGSTTITPPPITSTGNALFITYRSSSQQSVGFRGFRGQYQTNNYGSVGLGRGYSLMTMSTALHIQPPGDNIYYSSNVNYTWNIVPNAVRGKLTFVISYLDLSSDEQLVLYDGPTNKYPVLKVFKGASVSNEWYKTTRVNATLIFTSKRTQMRAGGFRISYFGDGPNYHCGFTTNPAVMNHPSMVVTDGSASPASVFPNQNCKWNIAPQDSHGVFLFFSRFSLDSSGSLSIYNGTVDSDDAYSEISFTEAVPSPIQFSKSSVMGLSYTSSDQTLGKGFSATFFGLSSRFSGPGDGIVWLQSSSLLSLKVQRSMDTPMTNMTYIISPVSTGSIYITFASINIPHCSSRVDIYDGSTLHDTLLASYCGNSILSPFSWIETTSNVALLNFVSTPDVVNHPDASFDLSYFSQGPNYHCGFHRNPGTFETPSMIFTDGSAAGEAMYPNQHCEWLLSPLTATNVVLQIISNDLIGGSLTVYDGSDAEASVLWTCIQCRSTPQAIVSSTPYLYVVFTTTSSAVLGAGFSAAYWSTSSSDWIDTSTGYILEVPNHHSFNTDPSKNTTGYWQLDVSYTKSTLAFQPTYLTSAVRLSSSMDGRTDLSSDIFAGSTRYLVPVCGNLISATATVISSTMTQRASQWMGSYITAGTISEASKRITVTGSSDASIVGNSYDAFTASPACKYEIDSGSILSIVITVTDFQAGSRGGFLRIYGGLFNNDVLLFDSSVYSGAITVVAPCGKAMIVVGNQNTSDPNLRVDYGFQVSYSLDPNDGAGGTYLSYTCNAYRESLLPKKKKTDIYLPLYFAAGGLGLLIILCCFSLYIYRHYGHREIDCTCIVTTMSRPVYQRIVQSHPRYTPRLDAFKNKFLPMGKCCVCQEDKIKVLMLSCHHGICLEDMKGYLESALGNIALFPVKCPMHYESCPGMIGADIAKRFLSRPQYEKFVEFSDRALYGEGMRCIFCNNYVNFPSEGHAACVECPYCVQRFCMRCKKPWHFGGKCPLDHVDDSLETWKRDSGAQKCPSCHKLIEKDDPDTCNHMVHKITDGIPCIRDRTDFCYLCGEEVLPDYPHNEVRNAGVNHFPEGVFQKCRVILQREKDAEREKLKKAKRMRGNKSKPGAVNMDGWDDDEVAMANGASNPSDRFDEQWNIAMNDSGGSPAPIGQTPTRSAAAQAVTNAPNSVTAPTVPPRGSESPTRSRPRAGSNASSATNAAAGSSTPPPTGSPSRPRRSQTRQAR